MPGIFSLSCNFINSTNMLRIVPQRYCILYVGFSTSLAGPFSLLLLSVFRVSVSFDTTTLLPVKSKSINRTSGNLLLFVRPTPDNIMALVCDSKPTVKEQQQAVRTGPTCPPSCICVNTWAAVLSLLLLLYWFTTYVRQSAPFHSVPFTLYIIQFASYMCMYVFR